MSVFRRYSADFSTAKLKNHPQQYQHNTEMQSMVKLNKTDEAVIKALKPEGTELTLQEIADQTGESSKKVFKSLRKLFENELIDTRERKYRLVKAPWVSDKHPYLRNNFILTNKAYMIS